MEVLGQFLVIFVTSVFTGVFSAIATMTAIKVEIEWIKQTLKEHELQIRELNRRQRERNVS